MTDDEIRNRIVEIRDAQSFVIEGVFGTLTSATSAELRAICDFAIRALDTEADARLGKAVRDIAKRHDYDAQALIEGDHTPMHEGGAVDEILSAIAAALRAEVDR